jgi:xanthine dehydrogenase small subunit
MISRPIRFFHSGQIVEISNAAPTRTVLEWLREDAHQHGTKEGCNEGDCGACTVVVASLAEPGDASAVRGLALRSVNACLQFLPTLDGKALFTVEDLKAMRGGRLHPAQQAMVECHGSQCGFCTPGFVMSLWAVYEQHNACGSRPGRQRLADELSGNLCRCTGYRPILDAGQRMFELPRADLDTAPIVEALQSLQSRPDHGLAVGEHFHAPRTLDELATLRAARPDAKILAGSTDMGLWVTKGLRDLGELLYVGEVAELKRIELRDGQLRIGAAASLEDAWRALAVQWPSLEEVWLRFASPPIRHAGTMGGNVANGSPIGDAAPVLMALDARIVLRQGQRERTMPLREFYVDYMKNRLEPGEFVQGLTVPMPQPGWQLQAYKISKRFDCDISAVCAALAIRLEGDTVSGVRFAFGGMAATVRHAERAEAAVLGEPWSQATLDAARQALGEDFAPLSDMRASAGYRLQVARNLLQRFWLATRATDPLAASALSVWSAMAHDTGAGGIA